MEDCTNSPPTAFSPKLLPTVAVYVHVWPAEFVHVALADAPTVKHVTLRLDFNRGEIGELGTAVTPARRGVSNRRRRVKDIGI